MLPAIAFATFQGAGVVYLVRAPSPYGPVSLPSPQMDSAGSFQSDLAATFARLSASGGTYAIHGYEVKATAPTRVMQPRAYTPPRATL